MINWSTKITDLVWHTLTHFIAFLLFKKLSTFIFLSSASILSIWIAQYIFLHISHLHQIHVCMYIINLCTHVYTWDFLFSMLLIYDNVFNYSLDNRYYNYFNPFSFCFLFIVLVFVYSLSNRLHGTFTSTVWVNPALGETFSCHYLSHRWFAPSLALDLRTLSISHKKNLGKLLNQSSTREEGHGSLILIISHGDSCQC